MLYLKFQEGYLSDQGAPSEKGKTNLRYYVMEGLFDLWTESYANINCDMDFALYPFDTQRCDFKLQSVSKNKSYWGRNLFTNEQVSQANKMSYPCRSSLPS